MHSVLCAAVGGNSMVRAKGGGAKRLVRFGITSDVLEG